MKDYYGILGVSRQASDNDIKRAYRRLVQLYHPDRNPDPTAQEHIKEINEAYDVLGDPVKRNSYDYQLDNPYTGYTKPEAPLHRDPAYRRQRPYTPPPPKENLQLALMVQALKYSSALNWTGLLICLLVLVDLTAPVIVTTEIVNDFKVEQYRRSNRDYIITNTGRRIQINFEDAGEIFEGDKLLIKESPIFSVVRIIESAEGKYRITNLPTIYRNFSFVPILLFIFSVLGLIYRQSIEFRFNLAFVNLIMLIFTLILLSN